MTYKYCLTNTRVQFLLVIYLSPVKSHLIILKILARIVQIVELTAMRDVLIE